MFDTLDSNPKKGNLGAFLFNAKITIYYISQQEALNMVAPITENEMKETVRKIKKKKLLGTDG